MSSPKSSSSGTGGRRLSRLPRRPPSRREWLAAVFAAAAAVLLTLYTVGGFVAGVIAVVCAVALTLYLSPRRRPAAAYVLGAGLTVGALLVGALLLLIAGCGGSDGHVDTWVWIGGAAIFFAGGAWAVRSPRRVWWGLPLSMLLASGFVVGLATLLTGSTGACPD